MGLRSLILNFLRLWAHIYTDVPVVKDEVMMIAHAIFKWQLSKKSIDTYLLEVIEIITLLSCFDFANVSEDFAMTTINKICSILENIGIMIPKERTYEFQKSTKKTLLRSCIADLIHINDKYQNFGEKVLNIMPFSISKEIAAYNALKQKNPSSKLDEWFDEDDEDDDNNSQILN